MKLINKNIDKKFVESTNEDTIKSVLYQYLVKGHSYRKIGRETKNINENHGWDAWNIVHYHGFNKEHKGILHEKSIHEIEVFLNEVKTHKITEYEIKIKDTYIIKEGKEAYTTIKTRIGQSELRKLTLENYEHTCAFCNISTSELLFTGHIKQWSQSSSKEKTDIHNAILLCPLHDLLFEHGFISLSDNYDVLFKDKIYLKNQDIETNLTFNIPNYPPHKKYLEHHRDYHNY